MPRPAPLMRSQRLGRRPRGRRAGEGLGEPGVAGSHAAICQGNDIQLAAGSQANTRMWPFGHIRQHAPATLPVITVLRKRPASLPSTQTHYARQAAVRRGQ
jgi:hypothetical protein